MSTILKFATGVVALALLLVAPAASAAKYTVSFSGTMASGTDSGLFGAPGDLTGRHFAATYTYGDIFDQVPGVYQTAEIWNVVLTIGGTAYSYPTYDRMGYFATAKVGELDYWYEMVTDANPLDIESIANDAASSWFQPKTSFDTHAVISASGGGEFYIHRCCCPYCGPDFPDILSYGTFMTDEVIFSVPEPETWALMIGGFGLAGIVLRRQRKAFAG